MECGKVISHSGVSDDPSPSQAEVVAHSPTPSRHNTAARSKDEGKNAEAACDSWCSEKRSAGREDFGNVGSSNLSSRCTVVFNNSFSFIQTGIAIR
jgi:hypothetical protein